MLVAILAPVVIFFVVRFVASLYATRPVLYNTAGGGAAAFFILGFWMNSALFGTVVPGAIASVPVPAAAAPAAPATLAVPATSAVVVAPRAATAPTTHMPFAPVSRIVGATGHPTLANIDAVTADPNFSYAPAGNVYPSGSAIYVRGWAASPTKTRLKKLIFVIDGHLAYDGTANYGYPRPDVAKYYNTSSMTPTGYSAVALPTSGLKPGPHKVQVGGVSDDPQHYHLAPVAVTFTVQ
jgi:hypothetical protein